MNDLLNNLKSQLSKHNIPTDKIDQITSSIDMSHIDLTNLPATKEYLTGLLQGYNINNHDAQDLISSLGLENAMGNINGMVSGIGDFLGGKKE